MKLTNEQIKSIIAKECECPICGSNLIEYGSSDVNCDEFYYECECKNCGATFEETYQLKFIGHANIQDDDNEIDFVGA